MASQEKYFYVIVRNENDEHWTSHSDFVNGKVYANLASANAALSSLSSSTSPQQPCFSPSSLRPTSSSRSPSASSTSTVDSMDDASNSTLSSDGVSSHGAIVTRKSRDGRCSCDYDGGIKFEVRKIATRNLCGSVTWWFVDDEAAS